MTKHNTALLLLVLLAGLLAVRIAFAQPEVLPPVAAGTEEPDLVPVLARQLQAPEVEERLAAIGRVRDLLFNGRLPEGVLLRLCGTAEDPDPRVRALSIEVLGAIPAIVRKEYVAVFLIALRDPAPPVRAAAAKSLSQYWQGGLQRLEEYSRYTGDGEKENPAYPTTEGLAALRAAQNDDDPAVRQAAVFALTMIGDKAVLEALRPWLADPDAAVRLEVLEALRHSGRPEAVPIIVAALQDAEVNVRTAALRALDEYGTPRSTRCWPLLSPRGWRCAGPRPVSRVSAGSRARSNRCWRC